MRPQVSLAKYKKNTSFCTLKIVYYAFFIHICSIEYSYGNKKKWPPPKVIKLSTEKDGLSKC